MPKVLPGSKNAKRAALFSVLAIIYGILMPAIPLSVIDVIGGLGVVSILVILAISALIFSYIAIFKEKERSIITLIIFGFFCLVASFWLLFFLGNIFIHP